MLLTPGVCFLQFVFFSRAQHFAYVTKEPYETFSYTLFFTRVHLKKSRLLPEYDLFCIMVCELMFLFMVCVPARSHRL